MLNALSATPLFSLNAVILDTETTSLDPTKAHIVQFGSVCIVQGEIDPATAIEQLVKPPHPIPKESTVVHGISDDDVQNVPSLKEVVAKTPVFPEQSVVIGHNIAYDLQILSEEFTRQGIPWHPPRSLCTALLARAANPSLHDFALDTVCDWLNVQISARHSALGDAIGTAEVFIKLTPYLADKEIRTLAEAEAICQQFHDNDAATIGSARAVKNNASQIRPTPSNKNEAQPPLARIDPFPFSHRVQDIMSSPPHTLRPDTSAREVAETLLRKRISSILVSSDDAAPPLGIITEMDLTRIIAADRPLSNVTADAIMQNPILSVPANAFVYKALATLSQNKVRHVAVHDDSGKIVGVLTLGDLVRQRASDALILGDALENAEKTSDLAQIWARVPLVAENMLHDGIEVRNIAAFIAEETCVLTRRAFQLAEQRVQNEGKGAPPCTYSVLVLGSGGRGETLLAPDQDNAIVYDSETPDDKVDLWFETLATYAADTLNQVGLPYCKGGVMAKNRKWRHSLSGWKDTISEWIGRSEGQDLLHVDIFFDFRCVHGDMSLANKLHQFALDIAKNNPPLLRKLGAITADFEPPIGLFGNLISKQGRVDVKKGGLLGVVSCARVLALSQGITSVSTLKRLQYVIDQKLANESDIKNAISAQEILLTENLRQQLIDIESGVPLSNNVDIKQLSNQRKTKLKWAFRQVETLEQLTRDFVM